MNKIIFDFLSQEVYDECVRITQKFGIQNHKDGTDKQYKALADKAKNATDSNFKVGTGTWKHILTEEMYEAFAETDPKTLRMELIQCMAVCAHWIDCIDRRTSK